MTRRQRSTPATVAAARQRRAAVDDERIVVEAAAAFLAVRPRSVAETRRRLRHLGYREELVETVIARFIEVGYLDDEQFARAWIESRDRARPRGTLALRRELALKGVSRELVDATLAEREDGHGGNPPDRAAAHALIERRRATLDREPNPARRRQKAYALLARHGFDPETSASVAGSLESLRG